METQYTETVGLQMKILLFPIKSMHNFPLNKKATLLSGVMLALSLDPQVPDRFLEVAEITLQEFYLAISLAKDSDPSWKKAIYKVICKLDSDVPPEFKSPLST